MFRLGYNARQSRYLGINVLLERLQLEPDKSFTNVASVATHIRHMRAHRYIQHLEQRSYPLSNKINISLLLYLKYQNILSTGVYIRLFDKPDYYLYSYILSTL